MNRSINPDFRYFLDQVSKASDFTDKAWPESLNIFLNSAIDGLDDENEQVRFNCETIFRHVFFDADRALARAIDRLRRRNHNVPEIVAVIGYAGRHALKYVPDVIRALETGGDETRREAAESLRNIMADCADWICIQRIMGREGSLEDYDSYRQKVAAPLIHALKDPDYRVREEAVVALKRLEPPAVEAIEPLGELMFEKESWPGIWIRAFFNSQLGGLLMVRQKAAWALGWIGRNRDEAIAILIKASRSRDCVLRGGAIWGLGFSSKVRFAEISSTLMQALDDPDDGVRDYAARVIEESGSTAAGAASLLVRNLKKKRHEVFWGGALRALESIGPAAAPVAIPYLLKWAKSNKPRGRFSLISQFEWVLALGKIGSEDLKIQQALWHWSRDSDRKIRIAAMVGLHRRGIQQPELLPEITSAIENSRLFISQAPLKKDSLDVLEIEMILKALGSDATPLFPLLMQAARNRGVMAVAQSIISIDPRNPELLALLEEKYLSSPIYTRLVIAEIFHEISSS